MNQSSPFFSRMATVSAAMLITLLGGALCQADETAAAQTRASWPAEVQRAYAFEEATLWEGGRLVEEPRKEGNAAMRWEQHTENTSLTFTRHPGDLSAFNVMSVWLHAKAPTGNTFMIILESQREQGVFSYFSRKVTVDWQGWKHLTFHFRSFGKARQPAGWQKIDRLRFTASGWNQRPSNEPVWTIDQLEFLYTDKPYRPEIRVNKYVREPEPEAFLKHLRPGHPRLILLDEQIPAIRQAAQNDPLVQNWYEKAKERAEALLRRPVRKHELPDGRRQLSVSRDVLDRMLSWGFFYRMEGDRKWLDRAWEEAKAVAAFKDWNPYHYLDTAEMMHAMAIAYDWFYNDLTDEQKTTIRESLWQHGLRLSHAAYLGLEGEGSQGWRGVTNNWNFVCNGGTAIAAMALLDEMPRECTEILHAAFQYIQIPLPHFEPDGAWWEGIGYWGYSMRYLLAYLRSLETAFGTDFGFVDSLKDTGFAKAGDFPIYLSSPANGIFNFADSGSGGSRAYQHWALFYLANRFRNPLYLYHQEKHASPTVGNILYYQPFESRLRIQQVPRDKYFRKTEVVTMRSSWTDDEALFAGIKCGRNGIAHAHQDLGSFIFYALREKWVADMGTERQTYLSHQHHLPRHHFYRIREEGHNTLVFNPAESYSQDPGGSAEIVRFESSPDDCFAVADLTDAYSKHAGKVMRGYRLFERKRAFLVQDEISAPNPVELWWFAHGVGGSEFEVQPDGKRATIKRNGKTCYVQLLAPENAALTVMDARPLPSSPDPDIQAQNKNVRKLAVHLTDASDVTIAVLFTPVYDFEKPPATVPEIAPLEAWQLAADANTPALQGIAVAGSELALFSPDVYTYTVRLPPDATDVPALTVQTAGNAVATVDMPDALPGTAQISVRAPGVPEASITRVRFLPELPPGSTEKTQTKSKPATVDGITVTASLDDGNVPANVLDGNLETRWSANGEEEWIAFDFGKQRDVRQFAIAWFNGDTRQTRFTVSVSDDGKQWRNIHTGQSSGKTAAPEPVTLDKTHTARFLRITGYGNTSNLWNSITEVRF